MSSLEVAFRRFERAAVQLEQRHSSLQLRAGRLERELFSTHRRLETVLDVLSHGVAVVSATGELLRTNRAFRRMGLAHDGRLSDSSLEQMLRSGKAGGASTRLRSETERGNRDLAATLIPVGDEDDTHVLSVHDVTAIRREEEEGGRQRRLEALGRMAAELAHEVRNPVGSIRLFASMLQEDLQESPEQREMAEQILAASAGLESLVSNLLAFAAPARSLPRNTDLATLARDVCGLLQPACSIRGVRLVGPDPSAECAVEADPEGMRQILLNLVGNALAATEADGLVAVQTSRTESCATVIVADDGGGIEVEDLPRVFDPFFSRTEGGTGLGLSIVHGIVERHGGKILLDSHPGRGTRVRVELPADGGQDA